jgi:hypothetical protein
LQTYCRILMPERNIEETVSRLSPLLNDPELQHKIDKAAEKRTPEPLMKEMNSAAENEQDTINIIDVKEEQMIVSSPMERKNEYDAYSLTQVVGIIIGSPEFQRR